MFVPSKDELGKRVKGLQAYLSEAEIEGALLFHIANLYYYTGRVGPGSLFVPGQGEPVFLSRQRGELPEDLPWQAAHFKRWSDLAGTLGDFGYKVKGRLGLEMEAIPAAVYMRVHEVWPEDALVDVGTQIRRQRAVKSPWEIEVLRETARRDQTIFQKVPEFIAASTTDVDLTALFEAEARRLGHIGMLRVHSFSMEMSMSCILTGENGAALSTYDVPTSGTGLGKVFPMGACGSRLHPGKPILIDFSGCYFGYNTDLTRMFVIGTPPQEVMEAYKLALHIQAELVLAAKPGALCGELYERAFAIARQTGLGDSFMGAAGGVSFVGHGVGLEVDELPVLARGARQALQEGMVIALEPKFVFQRHGAVGIENIFVVTHRGLEKLSLVPDDFVVC